jgi:general secretion pathway protein J
MGICMMNNTKQKGFTLLEILIALFIFSILSMILTSALHSVINAQEGTEKSAEQLRDMQLALLMFSRDVEQAVNRPIISANGKEEAALIGSTTEITFTHAGLANPKAALVQSNMQRVRYYWGDQSLWRMTWPVLDLAPQTSSHARRLLSSLSAVTFQYLDSKGQFHREWPQQSGSQEALPRAVQITFSIENRGDMTQLYVIPAK